MDIKFIFLWGLYFWLIALCSESSAQDAAVTNNNGTTNCRPDGLSIRCTKTGYASHTLTVNSKLRCYDGSHCLAIYYNISVYYSRCGQQQLGRNVKNYGNRFLRPYEGYSYHFYKADPRKCLEYVIHTCSKNQMQTRQINCNNVFEITTY